MARRRGYLVPWLRALLVIPAVILVQGLAGLPGFILFGDSGGLEAALLGGSVGAVLLLLAWWVVVTGEPLSTLGVVGPPSRVARGLIVGFVGGGALISLVVGAGCLLGAWTLSAPMELAAGPLVLWTLMLVVAAFFEELLLRGHVLQELGRKHLGAGLVISSTVFAVIHLANPNSLSEGPIVVALLTANIIAAGLLLSAAFLHSGDMWLPTGVHLGWNWTMAILFGLPVSGMDSPSILRGDMNGAAPAWSGSDFGPESSLIALVIVGGAASAWLVFVMRRGAKLPVRGTETADRVPEGLPSADSGDVS